MQSRWINPRVSKARHGGRQFGMSSFKCSRSYTLKSKSKPEHTKPSNMSITRTDRHPLNRRGNKLKSRPHRRASRPRPCLLRQGNQLKPRPHKHGNKSRLLTNPNPKSQPSAPPLQTDFPPKRSHRTSWSNPPPTTQRQYR